MKEYWDSLLDKISIDDEFISGSTFLKACVFVEESRSSAIIACAGEFAANFIKQNSLSKIKDYIAEKSGQSVELSVVIDPQLVEENSILEDDSYNIDEPQLNKDIDLNLIQSEARVKANLNDYFRFENFVIGTNNRYVFAAAKHVASNAGKEYNPFYIYGGVGLGKTHILQSIGNSYINEHPHARIAYIDGSGFRDEFVSGILSKKPDYFKKKYRSLDMFLLDDLQLLETAQETSKELFEIFQALDSSGKQMVFVSDKPPKELQNIEARLKSRFERSLILPIEPPQYETRVAIIERKLEDLKTSMSREIVQYMAENITTDVRKIEGALRAYLSIRDLMGITPNVSQCEELGIFKDYFTNKPKLKGATIKEIMKIVAGYYGVEMSIFTSRERSKYISKIRHIAMYLASEYSGKSTTEIGLEFNRDHASVIYAREKVRRDLKTCSPLATEIEGIISGMS